MSTSIEWAANPDGSPGKTWNPLAGCQRVSPGCGGAKGQGGCYAERMAVRLGNMGVEAYQGLTNGNLRKPRWTGEFRELPERLIEPLRRKKPITYFVNSMSDLFGASFGFVAAVFGVMDACPQHRFIILTKRPGLAQKFFAWLRSYEAGLVGHGAGTPAEACRKKAMEALDNEGVSSWRHQLCGYSDNWPLPNVILGVSVEDQARADERVPLLLECPAAVRAVSYEPALEKITLERVCDRRRPVGLWLDTLGTGVVPGTYLPEKNPLKRHSNLTYVDWVICGAESGPGARPFDLDWARSMRDQCVAADVPFFFKQSATPGGKKVSLPELDGQIWAQRPAMLRQC